MKPSNEPTQVDALASAYVETRRGLLAVIRRKVGDAQVAEDLLHDVFVKAATAIANGRAPSNMTGWLYQVVRTTIVDRYRAKRLPEEPMDHEPTATEPEDLLAFQSLAMCMEPLSATLPPIYRDALVAADLQGRRLADIASTAGLSVTAVKSRVSRARKLLRQRLLDCCTVALGADCRIESYRPRNNDRCNCEPQIPAVDPSAV